MWSCSGPGRALVLLHRVAFEFSNIELGRFVGDNSFCWFECCVSVSHGTSNQSQVVKNLILCAGDIWANVGTTRKLRRISDQMQPWTHPSEDKQLQCLDGYE